MKFLIVVLLASCTPAFRECESIEPTLLAELPDQLSATGLFGPDVRPFTPQFPAWSDGADKKRWIYLPLGSQIDTSDPDAWNFPAGTKLWKEFSVDGTRVETRMLFKHGAAPDAWTPLAYVWTGTDAIASPAGTRVAQHEVPSAGACIGCHGGTPSGILGFSAIQLPEQAAPGEVGLADLRAAHQLTRTIPAVVIPGDATTRAALGYLHANCSHCHNQVRPHHDGPRCFDPERSFSFMLRTTELATPAATATYRTAIGDVISAGDPDGSEVVDRIQSRDSRFGMPALGTDVVDARGVALLIEWIRAL